MLNLLALHMQNLSKLDFSMEVQYRNCIHNYAGFLLVA